MIEFLGQPTKIDVIVNNQPLSNIGEINDINFMFFILLFHKFLCGY